MYWKILHFLLIPYPKTPGLLSLLIYITSTRIHTSRYLIFFPQCREVPTWRHGGKHFGFKDKQGKGLNLCSTLYRLCGLQNWSATWICFLIWKLLHYWTNTAEIKENTNYLWSLMVKCSLQFLFKQKII